ncbi:MAG: [FeFe] hydrogenase H-cluster radical SAM maturase HydG [Proteobacteria bacterium]|nr:[FeFe] hydrogenase H-cluster radical SAM maturase HydG [Pseudomonadota bacterium]
MAIIDHEAISRELTAQERPEPARVREILARAREMQGVPAEDLVALSTLTDGEMLGELFETARWIKDSIYGKRLVLFAPLYISNLCDNDCAYCAFRAANKDIERRALCQDEIRLETAALLSEGQKRVLLVAGESYADLGLSYIFRSIETIYGTKSGENTIRRINVNIAPLSVDEFRELHSCNIGTYQLFQETYHSPTYRRLHPRGPKSDYDYRLTCMDRAFEGGFDDVGIGVLFGLYDWRYEILALMKHIAHLEGKFGVGPHTISVPRIEPACGAPLSYRPPHPVSDDDFRKIIALLRIAIPYTGIILSTRESAAIRRESFELGVSQISAGSRTNPGGYAKDGAADGARAAQFSLGDTRPLMEVIRDIVAHDHIPSFCTACYRLGRVGKDFMDLAKPGLIKDNCTPNGILTFAEYLHDFAGDDLREEGYDLIGRMLQSDVSNPALRVKVKGLLDRIASGSRDIFV